jgi:Zn-dependent M28 family amino/carboxypeptidase
VRDRIVAELKAAGYAPEVQRRFSASRRLATPAAPRSRTSSLARGTGSGKAVLVSAHYDSVPGGPGVSDDGAGVAVVLELARTFSGKQTGNDIVFLISDGEETGLRGAHAFAERHP